MPRRLRIGYARAVRIAADGENYTLTGQGAGVLHGRRLDSGQGSYSLTGQDATLTSGGSGENAARIITALSGHTVPFSYNAPADPVITSSATVTTATVAANIVSGRRLTLQAGSYGSLTFNVDDLDVICQSGVTFTGISIAGDRIRITGGGGTTTAAFGFSARSTDLMIDNIDITGGGIVLDGQHERICFKNVSNFCTGSPFAVIGSLASGPGATDLFWLASESEYNGVESGRSPWRLQGWKRVVVANSRFVGNQGGVRFHTDNTNDTSLEYVDFHNNQVEGVTFFVNPGAGTALLGPGWATSNNFYRPGLTSAQGWDVGVSAASRMDSWTFTGNRVYRADLVGGTISILNTGSMTNTTASDNINALYTSTPAWSGGAS